MQTAKVPVCAFANPKNKNLKNSQSRLYDQSEGQVDDHNLWGSRSIAQ